MEKNPTTLSPFYNGAGTNLLVRPRIKAGVRVNLSEILRGLKKLRGRKKEIIFGTPTNS